MIAVSIFAEDPPDPPGTVSVTVYFIRHANSVWNEATDIFSTLSSPSSPSSRENTPPESPRSRSSTIISGATGFMQNLLSPSSSQPPSPPSSGRSRSGTVVSSAGTLPDSIVEGIGLVSNLATAAVKTARGLWHGTFLDAPLSEKGIEQSRALAEWLESQCPSNPMRNESTGDRLGNPDACILNRRDVEDKTVLLASNLRRTHQTLITGLQYRLARSVTDNASQYETIHILKYLQEMGCNTDARPDKTAGRPTPDKCYCNFNTLAYKRDPMHENLKTLPKEDLEDQTLDVCDNQVTERQSFGDVIKSLFSMEKFHGKKKFIIVGHSHWFQHFFRHYYKGGPGTSGNALATGLMFQQKKLPNTGIAKFKIIVDTENRPLGGVDYKLRYARIDPESPTMVYNPDVTTDDEPEYSGDSPNEDTFSRDSRDDSESKI